MKGVEYHWQSVRVSVLNRKAHTSAWDSTIMVIYLFKTKRSHALKQILCIVVSRAECAPRKSQRPAEELLALRLLAAPPERTRQVGRRNQRALVLCAEQAGLLDEDLALDLHGLSVLALL